MEAPLLMQVAHAKNPNFGFAGPDRPDPVYPDDFILVAVVEVPEGQEPNVEHAFQMTNHIDCDWWENPGVTLVGEPKHRSTSVGDVVIMPDGKALLCASVGWKEIHNKNRKAKGA